MELVDIEEENFDILARVAPQSPLLKIRARDDDRLGDAFAASHDSAYVDFLKAEERLHQINRPYSEHFWPERD